MKYTKDLEISRIRMGELTDNMSLTEKVGLICDILSEIVRAVSVDLTNLELDNFSQGGIKDIQEMAREVASEVVSEVMSE